MCKTVLEIMGEEAGWPATVRAAVELWGQRVWGRLSAVSPLVPPARRVCDPDRVCRECLRSAYVEKECGYMMDVSAFTLLPTRLTRMTSIVHFAPKAHRIES